MPPQIEVISGAQSWRFSVEADRTSIGKAAENEIALEHDATASHLHAVLERFPAGWCVTDLGSSNGTWVNGERVWSARRLRDSDEIRVGQTRLTARPRSGWSSRCAALPGARRAPMRPSGAAEEERAPALVLGEDGQFQR